MMSVIMLSVIMLSLNMMSVVILSVVMPSEIIFSVKAFVRETERGIDSDRHGVLKTICHSLSSIESKFVKLKHLKAIDRYRSGINSD